jgi:hypothetical protein
MPKGDHVDTHCPGNPRITRSKSFVEIRDRKDCGGALEGLDERALVVQIGCDHLDSLSAEGFGFPAVGVTSNAPNFEEMS